MFFLYPIYRDYPIIVDLRAYYSFPNWSNKFKAITFGWKMYIVAEKALEGPSWYSNEVFVETTKTLTHEIEHTLQYRSHGWSMEAFGFEYLRQWCQNGRQYDNIRYERQARATEDMMKYFLEEEIGYAFFRFWKERYLLDALGYPTQLKAKDTSLPNGYEENQVEVQFQNGTLQHQIKDGKHCFRILYHCDVMYRQFSGMCNQVGGKASWCPMVQDRWRRKLAQELICVEDL
jgi:hypothetical protein